MPIGKTMLWMWFLDGSGQALQESWTPEVFAQGGGGARPKEADVTPEVMAL